MNQYLVGHRGAAGLAPENTIKSFKKALEVGADVVECDIQLSKDEELVVMHDNTLDRTTNKKGRVKDYTLEELKQLDAGEGEKIPTLSEVVDTVLQHHRKLTVEIKGEDYTTARKIMEQFIGFIKQRNVETNLSAISFWFECLRLLKTNYPHIQTGILIAQDVNVGTMLKWAKDIEADILCVAHNYISEELVEKTHARGLTINAWTLNENTAFNRIKNMGVDYLSTDYPNRFKL
jgi:glycerophosphoryl diester phosphodiesterase